MLFLVFLIPMLLSPLVFAAKGKAKYLLTALLALAGISLSGYLAANVLLTGEVFEHKLSLLFLERTSIVIDKFSAFFILLVNIAMLTAMWYSRGYMKLQQAGKSPIQLSLHYQCYLLLYFSMIMALMFRDAISFLLVWELMTVASFLLIVIGNDHRKMLKAAITYLVQMHVGFFVLLAAFMLLNKSTGEMSFDALGVYFSTQPNVALFLLFFVGFGMKAGFVPLHTWLPETYAAAPANVGGFMSGAVSKMGLYGLIRVLCYVQNDLFTIGVVLLAVSIATGLFGICLSIVQKDIKRLLAYSSIENVGIIGIGLGLGILGKSYNNELLAICGFSGALLHTFNHSVVKTLLFFSSSSLCVATGTQNMELMGGAVKRMPQTSLLFLLGSIAICALPPFNGFISEFIIYSGAFSSLADADHIAIGLLMAAIVTLALIGGLSIIAFSKAFGIPFLGEPRSKKAAMAKEVSKGMYQSLLIPAVLIVLVGLLPTLFTKPLCLISGECLSIDYANSFNHTAGLLDTLSKLSFVCMIFIALVAVLYFIRRRVLARRMVEQGPTWGCGYTAPTPKQQYTSASYVSDFAHLLNPITRYKREMEPIKEEDIFPAHRTFKGSESDVVSSTLVNRPLEWLNKRFFRLAIFQTGKVQHYILYAFLFMLLIFVLSYFGIL